MSIEQLRAIHGATSVATAYGFKVEIEPNGLMRFRNGRDSGTCKVADANSGMRVGRLIAWRGCGRPAINELREALREA